jgi:S1-C subfamily serine protease
MQLDATAYPGNSGGPVIDIETGDVVGVLQGGVVKGTREAALSAPTGISYAVLIRDAAPLLKSIDAP